MGVKNIKTGSRNGDAVALRTVKRGDELMIISADGTMIRTHTDHISTLGRNTKGVIVMRLREGDKVGAVARIPEKIEEE
jgi:DNA gyrase subunit A